MVAAMRTLPLLIALLLTGCAEPPPEAPTDLSELSLFLFANLNSEDVAVLAVAANNMRDFLNDVDSDGSLDPSTDRGTDDEPNRTWGLPVLEGDDFGGVAGWDGADPALQLPVAVAMRSAYDFDDHGRVLKLTDQTPVEPVSSASYEREFLTDEDCFVDGSCDTLDARETIYRSNLLLDLEYIQEKEFRRVDISEDDGGGTMLWSRSWTEQQYSEEAPGTDTIDQWYGMGIWISDGDTTLRYNALWGSSSLGNTLQDDFLIGEVADGTEEGLQNTETWLSEN